MASERAAKWLDMYMETGDAKGAVRKIYNCSEATIPSRASQLKSRYAGEIDKQLRLKFISDSVKMYKILKGLATSSSSETVKLNAARDLLDRGGYRPDQVVRLEEKQMSRAELEARIAETRKRVIASMTAEEIAAGLKSIDPESTDEEPRNADAQKRQISLPNREGTETSSAEENKTEAC
mgnify:CR=1 FL=1